MENFVQATEHDWGRSSLCASVCYMGEGLHYAHPRGMGESSGKERRIGSHHVVVLRVGRLGRGA
jgi:hypothetical protein